MKVTNDDGTEYEVNAQGYVINPLFVVYKNSQKDAKDRIIGSIEAQYNFTPNWYLRGRAGGDMINRRAENVTLGVQPAELLKKGIYPTVPNTMVNSMQKL